MLCFVFLIPCKFYTYIWVNYSNSLTWNKAIWGWFPLLTMIPVRENSEVVIIYPDIYIYLFIYIFIYIELYTYWIYTLHPHGNAECSPSHHRVHSYPYACAESCGKKHVLGIHSTMNLESLKSIPIIQVYLCSNVTFLKCVFFLESLLKVYINMYT